MTNRTENSISHLACFIGLLVALLLVVGSFSNCATTASGGKKLDVCAALQYASGAHQLADASAQIVCMSLPAGAKRDACLKYKNHVKTSAELLLQVGTSVLKSCGL